jgi:hypothetical protein
MREVGLEGGMLQAGDDVGIPGGHVLAEHADGQRALPGHSMEASQT